MRFFCFPWISSSLAAFSSWLLPLELLTFSPFSSHFRAFLYCRRLVAYISEIANSSAHTLVYFELARAEIEDCEAKDTLECLVRITTLISSDK